MSIRKLFYISNIDKKILQDKKYLLQANYFKSLNNKSIVRIDIPEDVGHIYRGDFYGLLQELDYDNVLFPHLLFLNNMSNSDQFTGDVSNIRVYDDNTRENTLTLMARTKKTI